MSDELEELVKQFADVPNIGQRLFFVAYCINPIKGIKAALRASGQSRNNHWSWLKNDPDYAARWEAVEKLAAYQAEQEVYRRAFRGVRRPVLYKGEQVKIINPKTGQEEPLWEDDFSDVLAIFWLKSRFPDKYRDRTEQQVTVKSDDVRSKIMEKAKSDPAFLDRMRSAYADGPDAN